MSARSELEEYINSCTDEALRKSARKLITKKYWYKPGVKELEHPTILESFLYFYLAINGIFINKPKELHVTLRRYFSEYGRDKQVESVLTNIIQSAHAFRKVRAIQKTTDFGLIDLYWRDGLVYSFFPLLLWLTINRQEYDFTWLFEEIGIFFIRSHLCHLDMSEFIVTVAETIPMLETRTDFHEINQVIDNHIFHGEYSVTDEQIKETLRVYPVTDRFANSVLRYILVCINNFLAEKKQIESYHSVTLEHLIPSSRVNQIWRTSGRLEDKYQIGAYLEQLGNLSLLPPYLNHELADLDDWHEKRKIIVTRYEIALNETLPTDFDYQQISTRSTLLAKVACKIWAIGAHEYIRRL